MFGLAGELPTTFLTNLEKPLFFLWAFGGGLLLSSDIRGALGLKGKAFWEDMGVALSIMGCEGLASAKLAEWRKRETLEGLEWSEVKLWKRGGRESLRESLEAVVMPRIWSKVVAGRLAPRGWRKGSGASRGVRKVPKESFPELMLE